MIAAIIESIASDILTGDQVRAARARICEREIKINIVKPVAKANLHT